MSAKRQTAISASEARRIALTAQGFGARALTAPTTRHLKSVFGQIGLIQIDSVNVLARSHYLPALARVGPYDQKLLDTAAWGKKPILFEYWAHEASLLPVELQPLLRWRMARCRTQSIHGAPRIPSREQIKFIDIVRAEIEKRGALAASELGHGAKGEGGWWGWSEGKSALEWLFKTGEVATVTRRNSFERVYDLTERVLPAQILNAPTPNEQDAHRALIEIAARAQGVASELDLRDYFRMRPPEARAAIAALVEEGVLTPVNVEGWAKLGYLHKDAKAPRHIKARALLSPFDNLIFHRDRAARVFDAHIRIEIYTPAHKRTHGYYVLPFLLGDRIAARVDLKSERKTGALAVQAAHLEDGADASTVAPALAESLREMADWLGLERVKIAKRGDLARALGGAMRQTAALRT